MPTTEVESSEFEDVKGLLSLLTFTGITKSNGEARRLVQQGGIRLNDEKIEDTRYKLTEDMLKEGVIIQKGKKVFHKIILK